MKLSLNMANALGQAESVVTFDLAIYIKAKELQMRYPDEFKHVVIRLGGFHIALNYLSLLGKMYSNSGIEDLLIDSGVYAPGTTTALLKGKSYNRGVRAHKLCLEALFRLLWKEFVVWLEKQNPGLSTATKSMMIELIQSCQASENKAEYLLDHWQSLKDDTNSLLPHFNAFKDACKTKSNLFVFWDEYMTMVLILLQFIKAERSGNWHLHLKSTAAMVPYFFAMDRFNYARWLPVYLADMNSLEDLHPEVYREFQAGHHSVGRSNHPFGQVWSDMALEQSINCDSKSKGGIVGITMKEDAVKRWFLTSHERAAITKSIKEMCGVENVQIGTHKEAGASRIKRDESDVQSLVSCFTSGGLKNPFVYDEEQNSEVVPLCNIATGVVIPSQFEDRLLKSAKIGRTSMNDFVTSRLNTNNIGFWDPLKSLKIQTFSSATKKVTVKRSSENILTLNTDRELLGRLLVMQKTRPVDLKAVLKYELCSIPVSIVHTDGTLRKAAKSNLMPLLEQSVNPEPRLPASPNVSTALIIDAMALIQMLKSLGAKTFGEMAKKYFDAIIKFYGQFNCTRVDLVFDEYRPMSIKAGERQRRGEPCSMEVRIHSMSTPIPKQWTKFMSNPKNKKNLANFLCESIVDLSKNQLHAQQMVVLAGINVWNIFCATSSVLIYFSIIRWL